MKRRNMLKVVLAGLLVCATATFAADKVAVKGNPKTKKYHKAACKYYQSKGTTQAFASEAEAVKAGYKPCKKCTTQPKSAPKKDPSSK